MPKTKFALGVFSCYRNLSLRFWKAAKVLGAKFFGFYHFANLILEQNYYLILRYK